MKVRNTVQVKHFLYVLSTSLRVSCPLTVSQATAMEINDINMAQGCLKLTNSNVPLNDGTNARTFLAIGVKVYQHLIHIYLPMK